MPESDDGEVAVLLPWPLVGVRLSCHALSEDMLPWEQESARHWELLSGCSKSSVIAAALASQRHDQQLQRHMISSCNIRGAAANCGDT